MSEKIKAPLYKKWWVWAIALVLVIGIGNSISGGEQDEPAAPATSAPASAAKTPAPASKSVAQTVRDSLTYKAGDEVFTADLLPLILADANPVPTDTKMSQDGDNRFFEYTYSDGSKLTVKAVPAAVGDGLLVYGLEISN